MLVSDCSRDDLTRYLKTTGVGIEIGGYWFQITSSIDEVSDHIIDLYSEAPCQLRRTFIDFPIEVRPVSGLRRWFKPLAEFVFNASVPFTPLPIGQSPALLEWGINWCISAHVQTHLVLHSAVVEKGGKALILPAPSGSGKSTLCTALVARGWRLLSDELTLLDVSTGLVRPFTKPISLKNESIEVIESFWPDAVRGKLCTDTLKGCVTHFRPPVESMSESRTCAQPAMVIFPRYDAGSHVLIEPVDKGAAFIDLVNNAFNYHVLGEQGFHTLHRLLKNSDVYDVQYSSLDAVIVEIERCLFDPS